jgi:TrmH family RNA methyltransferase
VTSRAQNDVERWWQALASDQELVLLDGFHAVKHALRFRADVPLIVSTDKQGLVAMASALAPDLVGKLAARVVEVTADLYRKLLPRTHPTGTAAWARRPPESFVDVLRTPGPRNAPVVVLDNPRNLGNVGAVVRLAAGMGCSGVLTTGGVDPWHPQVVRGSAGLHFAIPVLSGRIDTLPAGPLIAFDANGTDLRLARIPDNALLAFGSERLGISTAVRGKATSLLAIPMQPKVSSYNLATSVAMVLYHWSLQRLNAS